MAQNGQILPSEKQHRRETRQQIWLPMGLLLLIIVICLVLVMSPLFPPAKREGVSLIADLMLTALVLCPSAICLFALAVGAIALAAAVGQLHGLAAKPLQRAELLTQDVKERVQTTGETVARKSLDLNVRWAFFDRLLSIFERPPSSKDDQS